MIGQVQRAKVEVALRYEQRADAAAAAVLRALLDVTGENIEGSIAGRDIEFLHQLRIAVRRARTVQRQFKGVFPGLELPGYRAEFRWVQRATGTARDLDVALEGFDKLAGMLAADRLVEDLEPVRAVLADDRRAAGTRLTEALRSQRLLELFEDWERTLEQLVELPLEDRADARRSIGSLTGERVAKVYKQIVKRGEKIDADSPAEEYHALRKKGKELRYLLELFAARLYDEDLVNGLIAPLKELQNLLGRHQDREVQRELLQQLVPAVGRRPGGARACVAIGVLIDRLTEDELAAREEFAERFAAFAAPDRRKLVAETFR
jgi:CHAD domain-containing protein